MFAGFAVIIMIFVAFTGISRGASADDAARPLGEIGASGSDYGPGMVRQSQRDGTSTTQFLPTFRRWDGAWRPVDQMALATDDWPYRLRDLGGAIAAETAGGNFTQAKIPAASYEFLPDRVKETIQLSWVTPPVVVNDLGDVGVMTPFSTDFDASVEGLSVVLRDSTRSEVWRTAPFVAWDSSEPVTTFEEPVVSVEIRDGFLVMRLNATMLATAQWPIYLDPTWTLSAAAGWGANFILPHIWDYLPWWAIPGFVASNAPPTWLIKAIELAGVIIIGLAGLAAEGCL